MNLQQLTTFCTVLSEGSMTAAADKLFLTQPAVSQQVRNLEDALGVELLVRGVRQVRPTLQGQMLYDYAKRILYLTQQAEVAIKTMSQDMAGDLRIGTLNSLGLYMISPIVGMFLKHNSRLRIKLVYGSGDKIISEMRNKNINVAILPDLKKEYGIEFEHFEKQFLFKDEMWLVGSGRDTSLPNNMEIKNLASRPVVSFTEKYPSFRMSFEKKLHEAGVNPEVVFESDNVGTLKRVIESGLGWGFLPAHSIRKQVKTSRLTQIEIEEYKYAVNVNLYSQKGSEIGSMVNVFFRALQQQGFS
ncbi:MAG: LysR family transcriptional regulator [Bdellovibrionales bacterium]|nr:LysR family transcriptional regulator [Bdellovibrionales bacterium]